MARTRNLAYSVRSTANLRDAWSHVRQSALNSDAPESKSQAQQFERDVVGELGRIQRRLRLDRYTFSEAQAVVKRRKNKGPRPIVVATIRDRVVQRALLNVVLKQNAVREAVHTTWSFGGLEQTGVPDAIARVCGDLAEGSAYYLKTDIPGFFTSIRRPEALAVLGSLLPDDSINEVLDLATTVELRDLLFLGDDRDLFPTQELGVAQGCCLSPLLGNVLLKDFDLAVGSIPGVRLLRYIDDVLLLGPDRSTVRRAFRTAKRMLGDLGFKLYAPQEHSDKASEGPTRRGFDYLGCNISPGNVVPSKDARRRIRERIGLVFVRGKTALVKGEFSDDRAYSESLLETLGDVGHVIRGWSNQYSFCNAAPVMRDLDLFVDGELKTYLGVYSDRRQRVSAPAARRMLGVRLFSDGLRRPIYPLRKPGAS